MKRPFMRRAAAVLGAGMLLTGAALALEQGDSLISLSYLNKIFIPTIVGQGVEKEKDMLEQVYDTALEELDRVEVHTGGEEKGFYSADFGAKAFRRGDHIQLETGSGFYLHSGQAVVSHDGAVIDVTQGAAVDSGSTLMAGHRYLVGEDTQALVVMKSGLVRAGVQGNYDWTQNPEKAAPFIDVSIDDWYYAAVDYAYFNGLFAGMGEDQFAPQSSMDRSMMMTVLYHLAGSPEEELKAATATFADVPADKWFYTFVSWAADQGVSAGTGEGKFSPAQPVTREQVVVLLYNFATNYMDMELSERTDLSECADCSQVAFWSYDAMSWAVASGVTSPNAMGALEPVRSATRAEVASMLMNFSQRYL